LAQFAVARDPESAHGPFDPPSRPELKASMIARLDQLDLPRPAPLLELLLTLKRHSRASGNPGCGGVLRTPGPRHLDARVRGHDDHP
jgi:hypothetical protein